MKNRNLVFGFAIAIAAVGSAAAHVFMVSPVYVHGTRSDTGAQICTNISQNVCLTTGTFNCKVQVPITPLSGPPTSVETIGYQDAACTIQLKQNNSVAATGTPAVTLRTARQYVP